VGYWLKNIDWQTKFLGVVLAFAQDPSSKTLRPLIELYGRDRDRMKVEVEILERHLKHRGGAYDVLSPAAPRGQVVS